jgi:predicted transcriptional regulator
MAEIRMTLRLPEELHAILKSQAESADRSLNEHIVFALTKFVGTIDELEQRVNELEKIVFGSSKTGTP